MTQTQPKCSTERELARIDVLAEERDLSRDETIHMLARIGMACLQEGQPPEPPRRRP